uniref:Uncharacterized protein T10B6_30 n=1 Tax=Arabidopsis thaliana TaxID=3702 RepID=Q9LF47_ARATH|nr:hypothetical protein [Arabidopsis thaliana]
MVSDEKEHREQSRLQVRHNMKPELPGFYYDEEKNRYFPIKGPIPGAKSSSSSRTKQKPEPKPEQETNYQKRTKLKALKLVYSRELNGNVISVNKKMSNFRDEIQKTQASYPVVWRYGSTEDIGDTALKQFQVDVQTPVGLTRKNILVAGSAGGCLSILRVSKDRQVYDGVIECDPVSVLPCKENDTEEREAPEHILRPTQPCLVALSSISSIELIGRSDASENSHPEVNILTPRSLQGNVSSECTIWTSDCNISGSHAAIGTDLGAGLVDLETGVGSYFLRSKSDVFALQFHQSGNIVHCGLRNGAIVSVDLRERPAFLTSHNILFLQLQGNINPSHVIYMPSSLTCLKTLKTSDQYLMASSMDGTLYDQRMVKRGVGVQTYEGHVNSHTPIEFGIDPSERFILSGGDDCYTRIWSIKSGQLMSENKFSNSVPSVVCWSADERQRDRKDSIGHGAWLGSREAIFNLL